MKASLITHEEVRSSDNQEGARQAKAYVPKGGAELVTTAPGQVSKTSPLSGDPTGQPSPGHPLLGPVASYDLHVPKDTGLQGSFRVSPTTA